jgi:hypothetical protein
MVQIRKKAKIAKRNPYDEILDLLDQLPASVYTDGDYCVALFFIKLILNKINGCIDTEQLNVYEIRNGLTHASFVLYEQEEAKRKSIIAEFIAELQTLKPKFQLLAKGQQSSFAKSDLKNTQLGQNVIPFCENDVLPYKQHIIDNRSIILSYVNYLSQIYDQCAKSTKSAVKYYYAKQFCVEQIVELLYGIYGAEDFFCKPNKPDPSNSSNLSLKYERILPTIIQNPDVFLDQFKLYRNKSAHGELIESLQNIEQALFSCLQKWRGKQVLLKIDTTFSLTVSENQQQTQQSQINLEAIFNKIDQQKKKDLLEKSQPQSESSVQSQIGIPKISNEGNKSENEKAHELAMKKEELLRRIGWAESKTSSLNINNTEKHTLS